MDEESLVRLTEHEGRLKRLEERTRALENLATSVAVLAEQMKGLNASVGKLTLDVSALCAKPAKLWESVVGFALSALIGAAVSGLMKF